MEVTSGEGVALPNPDQGSDVKRADGCMTGAGWPSVEQTVNRLAKYWRLTCLRVLGTACGLHQTPIEGQGFGGVCSTGNSGPRKGHARDTLLCPRPGLLNSAGCVVRPS